MDKLTQRELELIASALEYGIANSRDEGETAEFALLRIKLIKYIGR
jgi:hypothetical protein